MKTYRMVRSFIAILIMALFFLWPDYSGARSTSFLSFDDPEMMALNLSFKTYIAAFKRAKPEKKTGMDALRKCMNEADTIMERSREAGTGPGITGRLRVIKGLLVQAYGLAMQNRFSESRELSVPIRSCFYELHDFLGLLGPEDYMIYFHNGVLHRAEPLLEQGRYMELANLLNLMKKTLARFSAPPLYIKNVREYHKRYRRVADAAEHFAAVVRMANNYVDPEYGAFMLKRKLHRAHSALHRAFGNLYLGFPEDVKWPGNSPST